MKGWPDRVYSEVVVEDVYHILDAAPVFDNIVKSGHFGIRFSPNVVIDLGANVGIFSKYLFDIYKCPIVSVEPDADNCSLFKDRFSVDECFLINKAIGAGRVYTNEGTGDSKTYLSEMAGYSREYLDRRVGEGNLMESDVEAILLTDLDQYFSGKVLLKVDIEGAENAIFFHKESVDAMRTFEYIAMELHYFGATAQDVKMVRNKIHTVLGSMSETHVVVMDHPFVYLTKK